MARSVGVVAVGLLVLLVLAWLLQRRLIYLPAGAPPPVEGVLPGAEEVSLTTSDGLTLEAWHLEAGPTTVLVFPGNAGNRAGRAPLARALADAGMSVLLVDYRGYGGNPGSPSEAGLRRDARAAATWAREHTDGPVVYFGESIGSGVAAWLATELPPAALVLRSPVPSLGAVAREHYGPLPDLFLRDRFDVVGAVAQVDVPLLVVLGEEDRIVPPALSRRVEAAARGTAELVAVPGVGHNDRALLDGDRLIEAVVEFVDREVH